MFLVGLLFLVVALLPALVVLAVAACTVRLLWSLGMEALAGAPAPPGQPARSTSRAGSRPGRALVTA